MFLTSLLRQHHATIAQVKIFGVFSRHTHPNEQVELSSSENFVLIRKVIPSFQQENHNHPSHTYETQAITLARGRH
ncbi:hypothetical protein RRG08_020538 [Elysia crispata]|uniref:Uncharacterized protein n=1 Tax=Elysia crispata TaxID=231223 RepID=A0AAE1DAP1_9GAST|nr:hypothetical protein RRG08_020538 [Elysia crispata]